ncbi:MAG: hypothetical protein WCF04_07650 [Candidatus Nanopelagicales bacterium]
MTGSDQADHLLEVISVDCYNAGEQMTAFYEVFAEEVPLPTTATVVGVTVWVVGIDVAEHGQELTARCQRGEVVQDLRLSDLMFPADAPAAWIHAAYRRCLGLMAHPSAMPAGWKPSWL